MSLEINSLRKGRYDILRRSMNELASKAPPPLFLLQSEFRVHTTKPSMKLLINPQSLNHSWANRH